MNGRELEYQHLISDTLLPLEHSLKKEHRSLESQLDELQSLSAQLDLLATHQPSSGPVKILTDIGEGFRMKAKLEDVSHVFLQMGRIRGGYDDEQSVYVQFSVEEARTFIANKLVIARRAERSVFDELVRVSADLKSAQIAVSVLSADGTETQ